MSNAETKPVAVPMESSQPASTDLERPASPPPADENTTALTKEQLARYWQDVQVFLRDQPPVLEPDNESDEALRRMD